MKNLAQWIAIALLVGVVILQIIIMGRLGDLKPAAPTPNDLDDLKPAAPTPNEEVVRIPSLEEIDQRILHWTMHHGAIFSAKSQVSSLESKMDQRLDGLEKKLGELTQTKK